ncbi:prestin-like isoform X2 [Neocloeon triangulifer]|uniref:prestin-like isoform X2 n=1 Tax=Neocloeon triangulifer TaxID=2078957 RepID=UPI00286F46FA|nr:prestin-like isoform X2 [Neocloeon triangulifer]
MQTLENFQTVYKYKPEREIPFRERAKNKITTVKCSQIFLSTFPFFEWIKNYKFKEYFVNDVVAGCTIGIMHISQGLAASILAGVPPIVGLYMASFSAIFYTLMSTSRHISMGTIAIVCIMMKPIVLTHAKPETIDNNFETPPGLSWSEAFQKPENYELTSVQVVVVVCFAVGIWQILMGVFRLGIISVILSDTLVSGFSTAGATHIMFSQLGSLFGVNVGKHSSNFKIILISRDIITNIRTMNLVSFGISMSVMAVLIIFTEKIKPRLDKRFHFPFPIEMVCVIVCIVISMAFDLQGKYGVKCFGTIPRGLPPPSLPAFWLLPQVVVQSLPVAIVAFTITISMAKILSKKGHYKIEANQEFLAYGCSNVFSSFFSCIPVAGSMSRSLVQFNVGGKTQITSLVSSAFVMLVMVAIGPLFEPLPTCVLAAILIVTLKGMFWQVKDFPKILRRSKVDGFVWIGTFSVAILWDIDFGLAFGLFLSAASVLLYAQKLKVCVLGKVPFSDIYLDVQRYLIVEEVQGIKIIRISGSLHFANKNQLETKITKLVLGKTSEKRKYRDDKKFDTTHESSGADFTSSFGFFWSILCRLLSYGIVENAQGRFS